MALPQRLLMRAGAAVVGALAVLVAGLWLGHDLATTQADAKSARAAKQALADYRQAVADGETAATALREQITLQSRYHATLDQRLRHAPALATVKPSVKSAIACAGEGPTAPPEPLAVAGAPAAVGIDLTLAAVSLWNSALAGRDMPAGACRADDPAASACAAGAGLGLLDAWHNHAINAATCAQDRARYQGLIDYLQARKQAPTP